MLETEFVPAGLQCRDNSGMPGRCYCVWSTPGEYQRHLRDGFRRFHQAGLNLLRPRVPYLGNVISAEGVSTEPAKIEAVKQWPVSSKATDVRSFLGLASNCPRFIQDFTKLGASLALYVPLRCSLRLRKTTTSKTVSKHFNLPAILQKTWLYYLCFSIYTTESHKNSEHKFIFSQLGSVPWLTMAWQMFFI